jgi:hypothetical protein
MDVIVVKAALAHIFDQHITRKGLILNIGVCIMKFKSLQERRRDAGHGGVEWRGSPFWGGKGVYNATDGHYE